VQRSELLSGEVRPLLRRDKAPAEGTRGLGADRGDGDTERNHEEIAVALTRCAREWSARNTIRSFSLRLEPTSPRGVGCTAVG
jgi:hypothetical protein